MPAPHLPPLRRHRVALVAAATLSMSSLAYANDPQPAATVDTATAPSDIDHRSSDAIDRTWLYVDDARLPRPLGVVATMAASYTGVGGAATRVGVPYPYTYNAFGGNTAQPGGMLAAGAELGLLPWMSVMAVGAVGVGGEGPNPSAGVIAGLRFQLAPASWRHVHLVASVGYVRESWEGPYYDDDARTWHPGSASGANGAWGQVAVVGDIGKLRLAGTVRAEHVFDTGRDPLDVMIVAGASYNLVSFLRVGVEWVGQDLEESFSPGAEGGARQFIGPTASGQFLHDRLSVVLGPSLGLSVASPQFVGRLAVAYAF